MLQYEETACLDDPQGPKRFFRVEVGGTADSMFRALYAGYLLCRKNKLCLLSTFDDMKENGQRMRDKLVHHMATHRSEFDPTNSSRFVQYILDMCDHAEGDANALKAFVYLFETIGIRIYKSGSAQPTVSFDASRTQTVDQPLGAVCVVSLLRVLNTNLSTMRWEWLLPVEFFNRKRKRLLQQSVDVNLPETDRKKAKTTYNQLLQGAKGSLL